MEAWLRRMSRLLIRLSTALLVAVGSAGLLIMALVLAPRLQPASAADHAARDALARGGTPPAQRPDAYHTLRGLVDLHWTGLAPPAHAPGMPAIPAALCALPAQDCLAQVRRDPAAVRTALQALAPVLARIDALPADAVLWAPAAGASRGAPLPADGLGAAGPLQRALLTRAAFSFAEGQVAQGMAQACGTALRWRALRRGSNDIVIDRAALTFSAQALQLMTQMAAHLPAATPLPASCRSAMAPLSDAGLALCAVARREAAWQIQVADDTQRRADALRRWYSPASWMLSAMLIDARSTRRGIERAYAWACAPDLPQRLRAGGFAAPAPDAGAASGLACVGNVTGCAMLDVLRTRDPLRGNIAQRETFIAQLATLRQWLWLRAHAPSLPRDWSTAYRDLPRALAVPGPAVRIEGGGLVLQTRQGRPAAWRLPLPRARAGKDMAKPGP